MVPSHSNTGAVLFLCAMATGAVLLLTGLAPTAPTCEGVRLPTRSASYAAQAGLSDGRGSPGQRGEAVTVQAEPPFERLQDFLSAADAAANSALDKGHLFIELYGGVQALSDRTVVEDVDPQYSVVKLTDGTQLNAGAVPTAEAEQTTQQDSVQPAVLYVFMGISGVSFAGMLGMLLFLLKKKKA